MAEYRKPTALLTATEGLRSLLDLAELARSWPQLIPRSEVRPRTVMVLPGLGLADESTWLMRQYLRGLGHRVYGWRQGLNLGLRTDPAHRLTAALSALADEHGEGVVLIAHSVGALYARLIAWLRPEAVSEVITLAGPFGDASGEGSRAINLYFSLNPAQRDPENGEGAQFQHAMSLVPPVPITCVFTRTDGVLDWRSTIQSGHVNQQNLEVNGSHLGLVVNPIVWRLLELRLSAPKPWQPLVLPKDLVSSIKELEAPEA